MIYNSHAKGPLLLSIVVGVASYDIIGIGRRGWSFFIKFLCLYNEFAQMIALITPLGSLLKNRFDSRRNWFVYHLSKLCIWIIM